MSNEAQEARGVALEWINDAVGYRCPECWLFVCIPRSTTGAYCPRCVLPPLPLDEELAAALQEDGFDEDEAWRAVGIVMQRLGGVS